MEFLAICLLDYVLRKCIGALVSHTSLDKVNNFDDHLPRDFILHVSPSSD